MLTAITFIVFFLWFSSVYSTTGGNSLDIRDLSGENGSDYPSQSIEVDKEIGKEVFAEVSAEQNFSYRIEGEHDTEGVPVGVYAADYNKDRREDLLVVSEDSVKLFKNTGEGFKQSDALPRINTSIVSAHFFDYNNSGWEDLYLLSNEKSIFLENKEGEFVRQKKGLEIAYDNVRGASTGDYTQNGCADLFVVQSEDWQEKRPKGFLNTSVHIDEENGNRNRLFANNCGYFEETTTEADIKGKAWSLATSFVDFTNDGLPDIHVANDFNKDVVYVNEGDGTFDRKILSKPTNRNGMSSQIIDINSDGLPDIFVTNIYEKSVDFDYGVRDSNKNMETYRFGGRTKGNNLLLNKGGGGFVDVADNYGLNDTPGWGWSSIATDFQNDGILDIYHAVDSEGDETRQPIWLGKGEGFQNAGFTRSSFGNVAARSASELDFNSDGGMDIAVGALNGPYRLYRNEMDRGNFLQIIIEGAGNHTTLGTKVKVIDGDSEDTQIKNSGSDYMSQDTRMLHFGVGGADTVDIRVERPDGVTQKFNNVQTNRRIVVSYNGIEEIK